MLDNLRGKLKGHKPHENFISMGRTQGQAAVLVPITNDNAEPEVLLTLRSEELSTHAGEVSFPGGKQDLSDDSLLDTALRESFEEVGIAPNQVEVIARLSALKSLHGLKVTPFVGIVPKNLELKTNPSELSCAFTVPLRFFVETPPSVVRFYQVNGVQYKIPSYQYNEFNIWGLTAMVLVELVNVVFDAKISLIEPVN
ncbi:MAG: CoA pyrophosphatase [Pseudomonadales bacterium]|nr:CoA pyrophosphatase [Pseudomonadales bacterium]